MLDNNFLINIKSNEVKKIMKESKKRKIIELTQNNKTKKKRKKKNFLTIFPIVSLNVTELLNGWQWRSSNKNRNFTLTKLEFNLDFPFFLLFHIFSVKYT